MSKNFSKGKSTEKRPIPTHSEQEQTFGEIESSMMKYLLRMQAEMKKDFKQYQTSTDEKITDLY